MKLSYPVKTLWILFASMLLMAVVSFADQKPKSAPAPKAAPPSHAPAPRAAAPASRPGGAPGGAAHPGAGPANRGNAPNGMNRGATGNGNAAGRGPAGNPNANGRGPAGNANTNSRGPGGNANATGRGAAGNANAAGRGPNGNANGRGATGPNHGAAGGNANAKMGGGAGNRAGGAGGRGTTGTAASRRQPVGTKTVAMRNGGHATFRSDGHVRTVQTHGMAINHGMRGERHIVAQRNGRQVVVQGRHGGYSQRAYYRHGGNVYVQRTYYRGGRAYAYGYRSYYYGGRPYYGYAPAYYYQPVYYGWAYNPWPAPVYYNWGWGGQPWYGYYGPYYQPYPAYPYASMWLTDYLISENLRLAYEAQAAAGMVPPHFGPQSSDMLSSVWSSDPLVAAELAATYPAGQYMLGGGGSAAAATQMPADVKQAISEQIKKEIAAEKEAAANKDKSTAAAGDQVPAALDPNTRYFVVPSDQDLTTSEGSECALTPGDVIYRTGDTPDDDNMVDATVKSAKKDECAVGATVGVDVSDLQEMHNNLRQTMDEGLKKLAENAGKNGIPAAPDTKTTDGEVPAPAPDNNVADDLQQTQKDADQAEAELQKPN